MNARGDRRFRRGLFYGIVSALNVPLSQAAIFGLQLLGFEGWVANLLAVGLLTGPVYLVTKHVVWRAAGGRHRRAAAVFWAMSVGGLVLSTLLVYLANLVDQRIWVANLVNLATYGGIFLLRFIILDRLFSEARPPNALGNG
jgi:putative flippase GtrA